MKKSEIKKGDVLILKPGYGYWDTTAYPIGGNFRRAPKSGKGIEFKVTEVMSKPYKGCDLKGEILDGVKRDPKGYSGKNLACDSDYCVRKGENINEVSGSEYKKIYTLAKKELSTRGSKDMLSKADPKKLGRFIDKLYSDAEKTIKKKGLKLSKDEIDAQIAVMVALEISTRGARYLSENRVLSEKAKSEIQQQAAAAALAAKRGEKPVSDLGDAAKQMYDGMGEKDLEDFAKTSHKGIPHKVEEDHYYNDRGVIENDEELDDDEDLQEVFNRYKHLDFVNDKRLKGKL